MHVGKQSVFGLETVNCIIIQFLFPQKVLSQLKVIQGFVVDCRTRILKHQTIRVMNVFWSQFHKLISKGSPHSDIIKEGCRFCDPESIVPQNCKFLQQLGFTVHEAFLEPVPCRQDQTVAIDGASDRINRDIELMLGFMLFRAHEQLAIGREDMVVPLLSHLLVLGLADDEGVVFDLSCYGLDRGHPFIIIIPFNLSNRLMKRSIKKLMKKNQDKEKKFIQHWSPYEEKKNYDALEDPHAKYYFFNKSMNQHLKGLKKAIHKQPNETEKKELTIKIDKKLSTKLPVLKQAPPKTFIYAHEISQSEKQMKLHRRKRSLLNASAHQTSGPIGSSRYRKDSKEILLSSNDKPSTSNEKTHSKPKLQEKQSTLKKDKVQSLNETHMANHQKFLSFLSKKKQTLASVQDIHEEMKPKQSQQRSERHWKPQQENKS